MMKRINSGGLTVYMTSTAEKSFEKLADRKLILSKIWEMSEWI